MVRCGAGNSNWMRCGVARHLASHHFPFCLIHNESITTHAFCKQSKNDLHSEDVNIALVLQNVWLKAEGTLSNYNYHADFSMGREDMVLQQSISVFAREEACTSTVLYL